MRYGFMNDIPEIQIEEAKKKLDQRDCTFVDIRFA
jgi:hypothetical protein